MGYLCSSLYTGASQQLLHQSFHQLHGDRKSQIHHKHPSVLQFQNTARLLVYSTQDKFIMGLVLGGTLTQSQTTCMAICFVQAGSAGFFFIVIGWIILLKWVHHVILKALIGEVWYWVWQGLEWWLITVHKPHCIPVRITSLTPNSLNRTVLEGGLCPKYHLSLIHPFCCICVVWVMLEE